jgi:hypothetical protein
MASRAVGAGEREEVRGVAERRAVGGAAPDVGRVPGVITSTQSKVPEAISQGVSGGVSVRFSESEEDARDLRGSEGVLSGTPRTT